MPILNAILFSFLLLTTDVYAYHNSEINNQLKVKAAFILNLARFVEHKEISSGYKDVLICFYQYNFLKGAVKLIIDKKINNKPIKLKIIREQVISDRCDVVLIPVSVLATFVHYHDFDKLQNKITITDLSGNTIAHKSAQMNYPLLENKVIFRLIQKESKLRFEVNKLAAEKLGIRIGSELLKLGTLVEDPVSDVNRELQ